MVKYESRILTTEEEVEWNRLLENSNEPDIYFTPEYLKIFEQHYTPEVDTEFYGKGYLFFYGNEEEYVLYPYIRRNLKGLEFLRDEEIREEYYDITSPWGYAGITGKFDKKNKDFLKGFLEESKRIFLEKNIVTEFMRFHPVIANQTWLQELVQIDQRTKTVYIDLRKDLEHILAEMNKKTRNQIRKAQKNKIEVEFSSSKKDLKLFSEYFLDTMTRTSAPLTHLFPYEYFKNTMDFLGENAALMIAKYEGEIIAASLIMEKYNFLHYHFAATDKNYYKLNSNNLLLYEMIKYGKDKGYEFLHMGGSISSRVEDPVLHFKEGFSKDFGYFCTSNRVLNEQLYEELNAIKKKYDCEQKKEVKDTRFFPFYRAH